jgi:cytochrome c oxidase subunit 3
MALEPVVAEAARSAGRARVSDARTIDVSGLAPGAFGSRSLMWWGTLGIVLIEGMAFALAIGAYFYLETRLPHWPPQNVAPPDLLWGTVNTALLLASLLPNQLAKRTAEHVDLGGVRLWMVVAVIFGVAFNVVRAFEFQHLNVSWSHDAYGSIVWLLLGLHTVHIVTDLFDTSLLAVLMFTGPVEERRFVDVEENAVYWYFVVFAWLPIYGVIYWAPRLM